MSTESRIKKLEVSLITGPSRIDDLRAVIRERLNINTHLANKLKTFFKSHPLPLDDIKQKFNQVNID